MGAEFGTSTFADKVAFVTGAASGIGQASALAFARHGAVVAVCDVADGTETVRLIEKSGGRAMFIEVDVANANSVREAVGTTVSEFGRIDFAHNNAGIGNDAAAVDELHEAEWHRVISVNLTGDFLCMKYQVSHLERTKGAIVNTTSIWGLVGAPGRAAYAASKHGVAGLTKCAAMDHGRNGVRVNAIAPGPIGTPAMEALPRQAIAEVVARIAENRLGGTREVAEVVIWLCSPVASYVNGVVMPVDGGWLAA